MSDQIKKARKITDGALRNKERTRQKMIDAVGEVLKEKGYAGLSINNIIDKANVDRRLINLYFGDVNNLIEAYLNSKDYWMTKVAPKVQTIMDQSVGFGQNEITSILHTTFNEVNASPDLQKILTWEISEYQKQLRELVDRREALGSKVFKATDKEFQGTNINLRAVLALQIAGIYYLNLHAKTTGSTFCEIDINQPEGELAIKEALSSIVNLVYKEAAAQSDN